MPMQGNGKIDPVKLLKEDHKKVKGLFDEFEQAKNKRSKARIAREAILELDVHADIEEEIFYPAMESEIKSEESEKLMLEAEEEHHVVHMLIAELKAMEDADGRFEAKFTVLAENVRHHIKEEEDEMLPKAKQLGQERLYELGAQMAARKQELTKQYKAEGKASPATDRRAS